MDKIDEEIKKIMADQYYYHNEISKEDCINEIKQLFSNLLTQALSKMPKESEIMYSELDRVKQCKAPIERLIAELTHNPA